MEEKQIWCCGSSGWTRVIAWFQIIGSTISIIVLAIWLAAESAGLALINSGGEIPDPDTKEPMTQVKIQASKVLSIAGIVSASLMLIVWTLALVMALVLLRGSLNKNTRQIQAWMVYTVICLIIGTIDIIVNCFVTGSGLSFIYLVFVLAIQGFCLWVVGTHKKEIEADANPPAYSLKA